MRILRLVCFCVLFAGCSSGNGMSPPAPNNAANEATQLSASAGARRGAAITYDSLYSFKGAPDGADPVAGLTALNGTLYGTTAGGGASGDGTVFAVSASGTERVLHSFAGTPDGAHPYAGVLDVNGNLYGTTEFGGVNGSLLQGDGTVFEATPAGAERVLFSFTANTVGALPEAALTQIGSELYGTTTLTNVPPPIGPAPRGTVFAVTGSGAEHLVYQFGGGTNSGSQPNAGLTNVNGTLYGTTVHGGASNPGLPNLGLGTVFALSTSGAENVLHSFTGTPDGQYPYASVVDVNGVLYGTTSGGGANGDGCVFSVTTSGAEQVLYSFKGGPDGANPQAGLIDVYGTLYGTTAAGGANGDGTVFSVSTSGAENVLYSFKGATDGAYPYAGLVELNGSIYGTTSAGGTSGNGTVFSLTGPQL
jgi:uncharacterized repeat protein (TIGR03803 family)